VWTQEAIEADLGARAILADMLMDPDLPKSGSFLKHDHEVASQVLGIQIRGTDVDIRLQRKALEAHASGRLEHMGYLVGMGGHKLEMEQAISKQCRAIGEGRKKTQKAHAFLPGTVDEIYGEAIHSTLKPRVFAYGLVNRDLLHQYNALDTIVSDRCRVRFAHEVNRVPPVRHIWNSVIKDTVEAISQVESWGVPVDTVAMANFGIYTRRRIAEVSRHFECYGANPSSPKQMSDLLYDKLKLPCAKRTKNGQGVTDEEALEEIEDKHPIVSKLLEFRTYDKLRGTYAEGLLQHVRDDGRIHPSIDVAGATTGRTSSKEPNLQNQPRAKDDDFAMARRVFAAPQGKLFVLLDFSQLEYRVAAMLSGDVKMKQIFRDGKDVHRATAQLIARDFFKVAPEDVTEEMRDVTKQFNFGTIYNMQVRTLAARMGISLERAQQIQHAIMGEFTDLRTFIAQCLAEAEKTGLTWTWWAGQRARRRSLYQIGNVLYDSDDKKARRAVSKARNGAFNTEVQGTASDFCVKSLIELVRWIQMDAVDAKLILPIHDALAFEVAEDAVDEVCVTAAETMLSWDSLDVPFAVDIKVGKTLGDMKKYKVAA
jgi:DNA polymerase-1